MSNATFSRKPLVAAVLTTLAVFSAGAMAGDNEEPQTNVDLTVGSAESTKNETVASTVQNEQTWNETWAKKFDDKFTNASGTVTIGEGTTRATRRSRSARARTTRLLASSPTIFPA